MQSMINTNEQTCVQSVKKQLLVFLAITFVITYATNFIGMAVYGSISSTAAGSGWFSLLSIQMLFPAASAIICMIIFKDKRLHGANRLFLGYYMAVFVVSICLLFINPKFNIPANGTTVEVGLSQIAPAVFGIAGFLLLIVLNIKKSSREQLSTLKLSFGRNKIYYVIIPLLYIVLLTVNFLLNYLFKFQDTSVTANYGMYAYFLFIQVINGIIVSWPYFLGEEFGWRVYLQDRIPQVFGIKKGVLLIGVIWGLWHAPVIASGYNYPGHPVAGVIAMILFCITIGTIFSYAVFKTGSVWISAFLHMITNTLAAAAIGYLCKPGDMLFSFGIGIYGIVFIGIFTILLLKFGKWEEN